MSENFRVKITEGNGKVRYVQTSAKSHPGRMISTKYGDVLITQGNDTIQLPLERLLEITIYALTNTDLANKGDPRVRFLKEIKQMMYSSDGFNPGGTRIVQM